MTSPLKGSLCCAENRIVRQGVSGAVGKAVGN